MNSKLSEIAGGPAGTYFIVTDNSKVTNIEAISKLRLFFINTEKGPVNTMVIFQKGDDSSFTNIFGKTSRQQEKRGNFSISSCITALSAGPIAVINLRKFEDIDTIGVCGVNSNGELTAIESKTMPYTQAFNVNGFWSIKPVNILDNLSADHTLNFANIGSADKSIFVVVSTEKYKTLTSEYNLSLANCSLEIDEYPGLDFEMLLKNTFVDVYVFDKTFDASSSTNRYYGHLFNHDGNIAVTDLANLAQIPEAGFNRVITGSVIPVLKNENGDSISIDSQLNALYAETGIIGYINDDLLELENPNIIDHDGSTYYTAEGALKTPGTNMLYSHVLPANLTIMEISYPPLPQEVLPITGNKINFETVKISDTEFEAVLEQGIKVGDSFIGINGSTVEVVGIEVIKKNVPVEIIHS